MKNDRVKLLMEDMSLTSEYEIIEYGENDQELSEIAIKKGIQYPSKDLAFFKCKYAMVNQENRNKCTLPRREVKRALKTLVGKAVDKDHYRQNTVGYWLDSALDEDNIIAYGAFWKSNFPEDYGFIKTRMAEGKMKISFEAWGERVFKSDGSYDLTDIEFAGGALLFDTEPAFPDAEVMEFSTNRVLEFAKVVVEKGVEDPPVVEKKEDPPPVVKPVPKPDSGIQLIKIKEVIKNADEGGKNVDEMLKKYNKSSLEELLKFIDENIADTKRLNEENATLKKAVEDSKMVVENSKLEMEKIKVDAEAIKKDLDARLAAETAASVKERKDSLGEEYAKDMSDEDIMNDLKFENAKLKKELAIANAKAGKTEDGGLDAGAKTEDAIAEPFKKQKSIGEKAFGVRDGIE